LEERNCKGKTSKDITFLKFYGRGMDVLSDASSEDKLLIIVLNLKVWHMNGCQVEKQQNPSIKLG
jgi:hypothetical protein